MNRHPTSSKARRGQAGATLIEILVSMVILMVGLLGLVGVMIQSQRSQLESYQRVQALMLVQEMATRIAANKAIASCYVLTGFLGTSGMTVPSSGSCGTGTTQQKDQFASDMSGWNNLLLGASEKDSGGSNIGAVLGARGCITSPSANVYQVSVAWQGSAATTAPPAGITCGTGQYGADDALRRAVSVQIQIESLS
ncbi:MAG TPA: type IV pilus modification protein PilV [Ramlibacter sp.]|nr:type IV pilus modification protein PilV [Ramlibacter sp.]